MTLNYTGPVSEGTEYLSDDGAGDELGACILDYWRGDIQLYIDWWCDPVGVDPDMSRGDIRLEPEERHCILKQASWPGIPQSEWVAFQEFVRTEARVNAPKEPEDPAAYEARLREAYPDTDEYARVIAFTGQRDIPRDYRHWRAAVQAGDRDCFVWLAREAIEMRHGFSGIDRGEWYRFRMAAKTWRDPQNAPASKVSSQRTSGAPAKTSAQPIKWQQRPQNEKLYQRILRLAFDAASPSGAPAPLEAVRVKFRALYPQGQDTTAKQSAAALRQAWRRALQDPPPGIAIDGTTVSVTSSVSAMAA